MVRFKPLVLAIPALVASGSAARADVTNSLTPSFAPPTAPASTITGGVALPPAKTTRPIFRPIATTTAATAAPKLPPLPLASTAPVPSILKAPAVTAPIATRPVVATVPATTAVTTKVTPGSANPILASKAVSTPSTAADLKPAPTVLAPLPQKTASSMSQTVVAAKTEHSATRVPAVPNPGATISIPPVATAPVVVALPAVPSAPLMRTPSRLASREAAANQLLLARLDAQLAGAQRRLNRAEVRLSEGQRQLGAFTNVLQAAMLQAGPDARGLHPFVRVAQRYLGTPYVWGGESARGFDCSGFIMRVMRDLGYSALPHSAAEQFRYGLPIAKPLLKPGDIVFFANTYKRGVSHVGIYLGGSRFIHAANSKVGTIVSSINDPKWVAHYAGARRLIPTRS